MYNMGLLFHVKYRERKNVETYFESWINDKFHFISMFTHTPSHKRRKNPWPKLRLRAFLLVFFYSSFNWFHQVMEHPQFHEQIKLLIFFFKINTAWYKSISSKMFLLQFFFCCEQHPHKH
jgi:hypothetical protein